MANFQFRDADAANPDDASYDSSVKHDTPRDIREIYIREIYTAPTPPDARHVTFVCKADAGDTSDPNQRVHYAGIFYHEGNHLFGGHSKFYWVNDHCEHMDSPPNPDVKSRELDLKSVYGAHVRYLFTASTNELLTKAERCYLYHQAFSELGNKVCPGAQIGFPNPCL